MKRFFIFIFCRHILLCVDDDNKWIFTIYSFLVVCGVKRAFI